VSLFRPLARKIARTKFGKKSLNNPDPLAVLKKQPGRRVYLGLFLMALSFLLGVPTLAFLSYLSVKLSKPLIIAAGGPAAVILVHLMFAMGVFLAGQNYASKVLQWALKRFLQKAQEYRCPECGDLISIHNRKCFKCDTITRLVEKRNKDYQQDI